MTLEQKEALKKYRISRAKETIEDAQVAIDNNRIKNAMNRIYYSIFYIVSALAVKNDFSTSKHKQLIGWFNKNFIFTGIIDKKFYKIYSIAFDNRQESDYEDFVEYSKEDVIRYYNDMLVFVDEIEKLILRNCNEIN
jgi:uncharacterized protein (UPF0332 family)